MTVISKEIAQSRQWAEALSRAVPYHVVGSVLALRGNTIMAGGLPVPIGSICRVHRKQNGVLECDVIGFEGDSTVLSPLGTVDGVNQGDRVELQRSFQSIRFSNELIGRVVDARGNPIDDKGELTSPTRIPVDALPVSAMQRPPINKVLPTGVRAIDSCLTLGEGQRIGVFAGSGVGKSTLLGMLARGTAADVVVIGLIGERGREVREFLERDLTAEGVKKCVTVVATSDQPASQRILAAKSATAIAESFREQGKNVLLLMDSVTRFAMAQREIGLAAGEVPTTRGFPPSVFSMLPQLVERTGKTKTGSITAIYTVLVEGDDPNEPISDTLRGLLDGHIHLSRGIAAGGRYPAIDILPSLSRLQSQLVDKTHIGSAARLRALMAKYQENEDLINIGAYTRGSSPEIDSAIASRPLIEEFLAQQQSELCGWSSMTRSLNALASQMNAINTASSSQPVSPTSSVQTPATSSTAGQRANQSGVANR